MYIDDFIWMPDMVEKLAARHHVTMEETEDLFFNHPRFRFVESGYTSGEDVYSAWDRQMQEDIPSSFSYISQST